MPLIVLCGIPGSGKTTKANELKKYFEEKHNKIVEIINEESLNLDKNVYYGSAIKEKEHRAFLKSNCEKKLSNETITILDSSNYIKGYRYEIYCLSRQYKITQCVVYLKTSISTCKEYNMYNESNNFNDEQFIEIGKRMEEPNPRNRWDSPLFSIFEGCPLPLEEIANVLLFQDKKSKDPVSTKQDQKLSGNYIQDLDKILQSILEKILVKQKEALELNPGCEKIYMKIAFEEVGETLEMTKAQAIGELKEFKFRFLKINKQHPIQDIKKAGATFVDFIRTSI